MMKHLLLFVMLFIAVTGCGKTPPAIVEVTGTVVMNGEKLDQVRVEFMPDPEKGNFGPMSFAETDSEGQFRMTLYGSEASQGVVLGWHRVVLQDFKALNSRDEPIAPRFGPEYGIGSTTPIFVEVRSDTTTIEIDLDKHPLKPKSE